MPAKGQTGMKHSAETRRKISEAVQRAYDEGRLKAWATGLTGDPRIVGFRGKHTEETKALISANRKGKGLGNKSRLGLAPHNKGKPHPIHNESWRARVSEANSGPNHWNWKGGIDSENRLMRNSTDHQEWSAAVLRRDRWTCQRCGYKGRALVAHHIKSWSRHHDLRFDVSNGQTLCRPCHCEVHKPRLGTGKSKTPKLQSV